MKKALMILMALMVIAAGAFAGDFHAGVNIKGVEYEGDAAVGVEVGYTGDYLGIYGIVGATDFNGLLGLSLTLPDSPFQVYGGAGVSVGSKTITTTDTYSITEDNHNWYWFVPYNDSETFEVTTTNEVDELTPFYEAGVGMDMGPVLTKVGWTNYNGNSVSFTMAVSF